MDYGARRALPPLVGDDLLLATVGQSNDQLGQQLRVTGVMGTGPLGVKAVEPAGPTVGDYGPDNIVTV